eukprot:gene36324-44810_t
MLHNLSLDNQLHEVTRGSTKEMLRKILGDRTDDDF